MIRESMPSSYKALLVILLAAGLFTRAHRLGDKILWGDEGFVLHAAQSESVRDLQSIYRLEQHTTLPNTINYYWIRVFGDSVTALHGESLMWSVLALLLFTWAMFRAFSPEAALGAVAAMSLNAFLPEFAQMLRYPAPAIFFAVVWLTALLMLRRGRGWGWLGVYTAALVLFVFAHLFSLFAIFCLGAFVLASRRAWGRMFLPLLLAHLIPCLAIIPKFLLMRETGVSGMAGAVAWHDAMRHLAAIPVGGIIEVFYNFAAGRYVDMRDVPLPVLGCVLAASGAAAGAALLHPRFRFEALLAACVVCGAVFLGWVSMIFRAVHFHPHYFASLAPLFCMLLGLGADRIRLWKPRLAPVLLIGYTAFSLCLLSLYWTRLDRPPNHRSAMALVESKAEPGDFLNLSPPYPYFITYYWHDRIPAMRFAGDHILWHAPQNNLFLLESGKNQLTEQDMRRWHRTVAARHSRVWMFWVLGTKNTEDRSATAFRWMERHYTRLYATRVRNMPYANRHTGLLVLYRIDPVAEPLPAKP